MRRLAAGALPLLAATGCGDAGGLGDEAAGRAVANIAAVPDDVRCVRVTVRGATLSFGVTAAAPASFDLGALPSGSSQVSAQAFNAACAAVTAATAPTWVGDPVSVNVSAGLTSAVALTLRPNTRTAASVDFVRPARAVSAGELYTLALLDDGTVRAWGSNISGQLGDGTTTPRATPVAVAGLAGVRQVAAGYSHACALLADGSAMCWGRNNTGQLGDGTTTARLTPVAVAGGLRFSQISAGFGHTCGLTADAIPALYCWGSNILGEIGDGPSTPRLTPTATGLGGAYPVEVTAGSSYTCVRTHQGFVLCTGYNVDSRFGATVADPVAYSPVYTPYRALRGISLAESHSCGALYDGSVRCVGSNYTGQLGDGTTTSRGAPAPVSGLSDVTQVATGTQHACALRSDGTVWCWGGGDSGTLGDGRAAGSTTPVPVADLTGVTQIACGTGHCCARRADGGVWCWGNNNSFQLGDGTINTRFTPGRASL
ncbi:MAG: hypothetical protein U0324_15130 [Polyangiales bacterium]